MSVVIFHAVSVLQLKFTRPVTVHVVHADMMEYNIDLFSGRELCPMTLIFKRGLDSVEINHETMEP